MRSARLTIAILLAAALAACGEGNSSDPGGGGGQGGSGGSGGSAVDCGAGIRVLELDGTTSPVVLNDHTDTVDNWVGSCVPLDTIGNDVIVHFKAGEAGFYRFTTAGTEMDTVLYALADCKDGFSESACNDNGAGTKQSVLMLQLEAGQETFVVVDSVNVRQSTPFTLTAEKVEAAPATIDEMTAYANPNYGTTGVRLSGHNPDAPVTGFTLQLYGEDGSALLREPFAARFDQVEILRVTQEAGSFEVEGSFYLGDGAPAVGRVEMTLVDENGLESAPMAADTVAPSVVERGAPCDPNQALNACGSSDACVIREPSTEYLCSIATAPTQSTATSSRNSEAKVWGVVIEGMDPEHDVAAARLLPKTATGASVAIGDSGATVVGFQKLDQDPETGAYRGVVVLGAQFNGPCLPPANKSYSDCVQAGGNQQACYDAAVAQLLECYDQKFALIAKVEVETVDATGRVSGKQTVDITDAPAVETGGVCDPYGATGICPEGNICWSEANMQPETCHTEGPACPEDYGTIDLLAHAETSSKWVYAGDNSESANHGGATCGGGGPSDVFAFTAPAAGMYTISTGALASGVDTVVSVRQFCQLSAYDLACNDDITSSNVASRVLLSLTEGQTVYFVVGSAAAQTAGGYTLTVTRR